MTTVTFELKNKKPMTEEERRRLLDIRDEDIDYSDIAQIPDNFADEAVRGLLYRPVKKSISIRIDADVLIWLKSQGKGYQTRLNTILRQAMLKELELTFPQARHNIALAVERFGLSNSQKQKND